MDLEIRYDVAENIFEKVAHKLNTDSFLISYLRQLCQECDGESDLGDSVLHKWQNVLESVFLAMLHNEFDQST